MSKFFIGLFEKIMPMHLCNNRRVVVTGLGVVSSIGIGWEKFWKNLLAGKSGISRLENFDTSGHDCHFAGEVKGDFRKLLSTAVTKKYGRTSQMTLAASQMALNDAAILNHNEIPSRTAVFVGTTTGEIGLLETMDDDYILQSQHSEHRNQMYRFPACNLSEIIAQELKIKGENLVFSTACSSGNYAVASGFDFIRSNKADYALVGGADGISRIVYTGFGRLLAVATDKCQPFDLNRQGMIPGEGAGMLFLESLESAQKRNAPIYAEISGCGMSCDAHHMTNPDPHSVASAILKSLKAGGVNPGDIDYISAHGTGTIENDKAESAAYHEVFGHLKKRVPISSIKSMLGHTMGAAAALESIACCLAIKYGEIPPTINFENSDPFCDVDMVPNKSRRQEVNVVLNNSQAFGGNNVSIISRNIEK